jgi:antitoxin component HigA of HigAB toxin-antitoxin module
MENLEPRIVKTDQQYCCYLAEVKRLAVLDPDPNSGEGARLELLALLVEMYEQVRTLPMIRSLYEKLDIAPSLLIREPAAKYKVSRTSRAGTKAGARRPRTSSSR